MIAVHRHAGSEDFCVIRVRHVPTNRLSSAVMLWPVVAPTTDLGEGALAAHYAGGTASEALGVGVGD